MRWARATAAPDEHDGGHTGIASAAEADGGAVVGGVEAGTRAQQPPGGAGVPSPPLSPPAEEAGGDEAGTPAQAVAPAATQAGAGGEAEAARSGVVGGVVVVAGAMPLAAVLGARAGETRPYYWWLDEDEAGYSTDGTEPRWRVPAPDDLVPVQDEAPFDEEGDAALDEVLGWAQGPRAPAAAGDGRGVLGRAMARLALGGGADGDGAGGEAGDDPPSGV